MQPSSSKKYLLSLFLLTAIYTIAGKLCLKFALLHPSASPIWAPSGIAVAAFILVGYRVWPAVFMGAFLVNITTAGSLLSSCGIALGNTLEGVVGAYLANEIAHGRNAFDKSWDVIKFVGVTSLLSTTISPTLGVTSLSLWGFAPWVGFGSIWMTWWAGDIGGTLIAAPVLLLWNRNTVQWNRKKMVEATCVFVCVVLFAGAIFGGMIFPQSERVPLGYLCFLPVIWAAYRFGPRETAAAIFINAIIITWGTAHGYGPFIRSTENGSLVFTDIYMDVLAITGLFIAAAMQERRESETALQMAHDELDVRVQERTISLARTIADLKHEASERQRAEAEIKQYENIVSNIQIGVVVFQMEDLDDVKTLQMIMANRAASVISGVPRGLMVGKTLWEAFPNLYKTPLPKALANAVRVGQPLDFGEIRYGDARVKEGVFLIRAFPLPGQCIGVAFENVTARRRTEEALDESEARFRQLVDSNIIGFMSMDRAGRVLEANDALLKVLGYTRDDLDVGLNEQTLTPESYRALDQWMRERLMASGMCPPIEKEFIRKDGCRIPVLVGMVELQGTDRHRLCFVIDVSERRNAQDAMRKAYDELEVRVQQRTAELQEEVFRRQHAEEELRNQAIRDPLTGIYNRRGFILMAEPYLQLVQRQKKALLLFMADLDDLKLINDKFGHTEGDQALEKAAELLRKTFRQSDIIARIGGDEFAVAGVEEKGQAESDFRERLENALDDYNRYSGKPYRIRLSIGAARMESEGPAKLDDLMKQADEMLYENKKRKDISVLK